MHLDSSAIEEPSRYPPKELCNERSFHNTAEWEVLSRLLDMGEKRVSTNRPRAPHTFCPVRRSRMRDYKNPMSECSCEQNA